MDVSRSWMKQPEGGWYIGRLNGRHAYSDGISTFLGTVAEEDASGQRFKLTVEEPFHEAEVIGDARIGGTPYVVFAHGLYMRQCYFDEARQRFPDALFYLRVGYPMIICKETGKIVGVIMLSTPDFSRRHPVVEESRSDGQQDAVA